MRDPARASPRLGGGRTHMTPPRRVDDDAERGAVEVCLDSPRLRLGPPLEPFPSGGLHLWIEFVRGVVEAAILAVWRAGLLIASLDFFEGVLHAVGMKQAVAR